MKKVSRCLSLRWCENTAINQFTIFVEVVSEKMKYLAFLMCALHCAICNTAFGASPYSKENLPNWVYPGGYDVDINKVTGADVYSLSYSVLFCYPAKNVYDYYDQRLARMGFVVDKKIPYYVGTGGWETRLHTAKGSLYHVHQFLETWIEPTQKVRAFLGLRYYTKVSGLGQEYKDPDICIQRVLFQFMECAENFPDC